MIQSKVQNMHQTLALSVESRCNLSTKYPLLGSYDLSGTSKQLKFDATWIILLSLTLRFPIFTPSNISNLRSFVW
jgi:hypothetical protein